MSFVYATGITAAGAADPVLEWFSAFELWIARIGWTVESGSGTKNLIIRSLGEERAYTMLWARVWESAANNVSIEVRNDLAGTQVTTNGITLANATAAEITYYMAGDLEAFVIAWRTTAPVWTWHYCGTLMSFALVPPDETYTMISAGSATLGAVLRDTAGLWDQDVAIYTQQGVQDQMINPLNNSVMIGGMVMGRYQSVVGELRHTGGVNTDPALAALDTFDTLADANKITTWLMVSDGTRNSFIRTGGELPTGIKDSTFQHLSGTFADVIDPWTDFIENILSPFLVGLGWLDLGSQAWWTVDRLFYSTGTTGTDDIFVGVAWRNTGLLYVRVQNDMAATQSTGDRNIPAQQPMQGQPYYISGDRDCFTLTYARSVGGIHDRIWAGKADPGIAGVLATEYFMCVCVGSSVANQRVLRQHDGGWNRQGTLLDPINVFTPMANNGSPLAMDGKTNVMWALGMAHIAPARKCFTGRLKFVMRCDGALSMLNQVDVGSRQYKIFGRVSPDMWAMRIS